MVGVVQGGRGGMAEVAARPRLRRLSTARRSSGRYATGGGETPARAEKRQGWNPVSRSGDMAGAPALQFAIRGWPGQTDDAGPAADGRRVERKICQGVCGFTASSCAEKNVCQTGGAVCRRRPAAGGGG